MGQDVQTPGPSWMGGEDTCHQAGLEEVGGSPLGQGFQGRC